MFCASLYLPMGFLVGVSGKEPTCQYRRCKRHGFNPWVWNIRGVGNGNSLQYSYLDNSNGRGAWQATVHGITESWTQLSDWLYIYIYYIYVCIYIYIVYLYYIYIQFCQYSQITHFHLQHMRGTSSFKDTRNIICHGWLLQISWPYCF